MSVQQSHFALHNVIRPLVRSQHNNMGNMLEDTATGAIDAIVHMGGSCQSRRRSPFRPLLLYYRPGSPVVSSNLT